MKVLVTGSEGFIGRNLSFQLEERKDFEVFRYNRSSISDLQEAISKVDFICHLAGVNRPDDEKDFERINVGLTQTLCQLCEANRQVPIIFASSIHVKRNNAYGKSKLAAEQVLLRYSKETGAPVYIFRLPHVIGKWCRPYYNSVVATFCHNIAYGLPLQIDDPNYQLNLVYIDDLVSTFAQIMTGERVSETYGEIHPSYPISVGELAEKLEAFRVSRTSLVCEEVGTGLVRALYATYMSYLPPLDFVYEVPKYGDSRGVFVEMLKTKDSGQFSFFTAKPGVTRGGHYHHSKTEKFLVIQGLARFGFRNILTNESHEILTCGETPKIVETVPGWTHDITNIGENEMIVMLWANEIFDRQRPDTITCKV